MLVALIYIVHTKYILQKASVNKWSVSSTKPQSTNVIRRVSIACTKGAYRTT